MKPVIFARLVVVLSVVLSHAARAETGAERDRRMAWWREARFGMFVHWGLYSGLAGTWRENKVGDRGGLEWIQQRVKVDTWEYAHEAVPHFRPAKGFATEWAKLAKTAGCRYSRSKQDSLLSGSLVLGPDSQGAREALLLDR